MQLINSFPSLDQSMIKELEQILFEKFDYSNLPKDYIDFLLRQNGGFVKAGSKHEEDRQVVVFNSPLKEGKGYWTPSLYAFYAAWLPNLMSKSMVKDRSLPGLIASNEHLKHEQDILLEKMMAIAACTLADAGDILCISLDERDYGVIYFFFAQWYNPAFMAGDDYYELKTNKVLAKYKLQSTRDVAMSEAAQFEIDRIPFIKVGDSFAEFLNDLEIKTVDY